MTRLSLDRPLAVFDIESTGTNPRTDRIIELAIVKLLPGGGREERTWRFQPLDDGGQPMAIPREASAIHGITNEDVAGAPAFRDRAAEVVAFLDGCDLAGYNAIRFDVPMLAAELERAGQALGAEGRFLVDPGVWSPISRLQEWILPGASGHEIIEPGASDHAPADGG